MADERIVITLKDIQRIEGGVEKTARKWKGVYHQKLHKNDDDDLTLCEYCAVKNYNIKEISAHLHFNTQNWNWEKIYEAIDDIKAEIRKYAEEDLRLQQQSERAKKLTLQAKPQIKKKKKLRASV